MIPIPHWVENPAAFVSAKQCHGHQNVHVKEHIDSGLGQAPACMIGVIVVLVVIIIIICIN